MSTTSTDLVSVRIVPNTTGTPPGKLADAELTSSNARTRPNVQRPGQHGIEAYDLAEQFEDNPQSVWGYVQGLTRLSQRTPWQDQRFALDRAASRLLTSVA